MAIEMPNTASAAKSLPQITDVTLMGAVKRSWSVFRALSSAISRMVRIGIIITKRYGKNEKIILIDEFACIKLKIVKSRALTHTKTAIKTDAIGVAK